MWGLLEAPVLEAVLIQAVAAAVEAPPEAPPAPRAVEMSAPQLLDLEESAVAAGDLVTAETILTALLQDSQRSNRNEARYRLAALRSHQGRVAEAAVLLRQILDEEPDAQRVRLDLAELLERLGDEAGARRALREAQAGGLPLDVAQVVDGYLSRLQSRQRAGISIEVALAPDSNINQATASDHLGTVFGDFVLDERARQTSGIGAFVGLDAFARTTSGRSSDLFVRGSAKSNTYGRSEFDTLTARLTTGVELRLGARRVTLQVGAEQRRQGGDTYANSTILSVDYLQPVGRRAQVSIGGSAETIDNTANRLQSGEAYTASLSYEYALSASSGVGGSFSGVRQDLRDPGYASTGGQVTIYAYRTARRMTLVGTLSYGRLAADERLFIYPDKRSDESVQLSASLTDRRHAFRGFAPVVRVLAERNASSIEIFDYRRIRTSFGLNKAF